MENSISTCPEHDTEELKIFCFEHQKHCCIVCAKDNHRECESLDTLDNIGNSIKDSGTVKKVCEILDTISTNITSVLQLKQQNVVSLKHKQDGAIYTVKKDINTLISKLEAMAVCFEEEMVEKVSKAIEGIQKEQNDLEKLQNNIQDTIERFNEVEDSPNREIALKMLKLQSNVKSFRTDSEKMFPQEKYKEVDIDWDQNALKTLYKSLSPLSIKTKELANPMHLNELYATLKTTSDIYFKQQRLDVSDTSKIEDIDAVWHQKINVLTEDEVTGTWITGGVIDSDGEIVICDFNNQKLKTFRNTVIDTDYDLNSCPWDIGMMEDEVLVCFTNEISKYRISPEFTKTGSIRISGVQGIKVISNTRICAILSHTMKILTRGGDVIKTFNRESGNFVPAIAASDSLNRLYYMDGLTKLVSREYSGKLLWEYDHEDLSSSAGIGVDIGGNVYVCCVDKGSVVVVSRDGERSRVIVSVNDFHFIQKPWKVWFDQVGDKFYISEYGESEVIEVFQLKVKQRRLDLSTILNRFIGVLPDVLANSGSETNTAYYDLSFRFIQKASAYYYRLSCTVSV